MTTAIDWLLLALLFACVWLAWQRSRHPRSHHGVVSATVQRLLRPRTPDDCPVCRQQPVAIPLAPSSRRHIRPWCARKSRRGAPKRINTHGFACPTPSCDYYRITDGQVHALVGNGTHGKHERIQTFRCQACHTTFSSRRHTPLYRLKTASQRVAAVLTALSEGLDVAAATRVFGYRHGTITNWLRRAGDHSATLHDHCFQGLRLPHLQLDELRTRLRSRAQILWLWLAIDPCSKIIPVLRLGLRTQAVAHTVIHDLKHRLAPDCLPVFTSDGLNLYFYALTAHFGQWVQTAGQRTCHWQVAADLIYGQVKKHYQRRKVVRVTQLMRCGTRTALRTALTGLGLRGRLTTALIERVNLTVRQSVAALVRRTWSTAQDTPYLQGHLEWWRGYYHFVRPHAALRVPLAQPRERGGNRLPQRYRQRMPAMAVGLTNRRWTVQELLALPVPPEPLGTT